MSDYITIPLSKRKNSKYQGMYESIVSPIDADLAKLAWAVNMDDYTVYAVRNNGKEKLHRIILSRILGREMTKNELVDHINGNGLDNRRENLRLATEKQNQHNRRLSTKNKSGYKGVSFDKQVNKWRAGIKVNRKSYNLGCFDTPEEAHNAYKEAAIKYHGEFANFGNE